MSVARFIADRRTNYRVPHTLVCLLGVSLAWFYKWSARAMRPSTRSCLHTAPRSAPRHHRSRGRRRVREGPGPHGSPRLVHDLRDGGWTVSERRSRDSMRRRGLVARRIKRRNGLTKQDRTAPKFPDLLKRDFTEEHPNAR